MKNTQAVIFDWDQTLASPAGAISTSQRIALVFQRLGLDFSETDLQKAISIHTRQVEASERKERPDRQRRREIMGYYQELLTILGHRDTSRALADQIYNEFGRLPSEFYPDSLPTLSFLKQAEMRLGILSNNSASARDKMETSLAGLIAPEHIFISQELGVHKPAKTAFRRVLARMKLNPQQAIFVGDNLFVDAIAAVQRGGFQYGIWIDRQGKSKPEQLPENILCISSLLQIIEFIELEAKP